MPEPEARFDYVVIGAGTAGCALASRLSEDPGTRVLLLEAGGRDLHPWIHVPVGYLYTQNNPATDWCLRTEPEPGLNGRSLAYPRGKVLGGCSAINGMIYMRGQAQDYDHWRQLGNAGWSWEDVLPLFKRSEDFFAGADEMHGSGGEWRIEEPRIRWEILDRFRAAAAEVGIPPSDDFNRGDNEGCGYFHVNQRRGVRWTSAKAFLRKARARPNLAIVTRALTTGLVMDGRRCLGVTYVENGIAKRALADGEVVLAAGAVGSPQILQLSGIGPGAVLSEHGIEVAHEMSGVGENLQDHLQLRTIFRIDGAETMNELSQSLWRKAAWGLEWLLARRGPLTMAPSQLGAFARSDPSYATPNLQYHIQPLSLEKFGEPLHDFPAITVSVCNLRPTSRGHIRIRDASPLSKPVIRANYLSTDEDRVVAADSIHLTRRIMAASALAPHNPEELKPGTSLTTNDELAKAAGDIGTTIFHPVSTCKMGPASDAGAVVDERLRVHGIERLRIADASIMPTITSGNTNSPTLMIAEKAAQMIREDARSARA